MLISNKYRLWLFAIIFSSMLISISSIHIILPLFIIEYVLLIEIFNMKINNDFILILLLLFYSTIFQILVLAQFILDKNRKVSDIGIIMITLLILFIIIYDWVNNKEYLVVFTSIPYNILVVIYFIYRKKQSFRK